MSINITKLLKKIEYFLFFYLTRLGDYIFNESKWSDVDEIGLDWINQVLLCSEEAQTIPSMQKGVLSYPLDFAT